MDNEKEIPFGAFDSELMHQEIYIPEGFEATIDGNKIILKKIESEDERIRKELIEHVKDQQSSFISAPDCRDKYEEEENNKYNSWLSWLEKQGEQKPVDNVGSKFKVEEGKWYVCTQTFVLIGKIVIIKGQTYQAEKDNVIKGENGCRFIDRHDGKASDYFRSWTIQDAKDGDILYSLEHNLLWIYKSKEESHIAVNLNYANSISFGSDIVIPSDVCPATKEQRDLLFQKMKEAGYEWDFEKKELKEIKKNTDVDHEYFSDLLEKDDSDNIDDYAYQCAYCMSHDWIKEIATWEDVQRAVKLGAEWNKRHHKSAWSDEDECYMAECINAIATKDGWSFEEKRKTKHWLKSIKDRIQPQLRQEWKQENTDDLTDFENAMMHIGESFFGKNAGLDPNDIDAIKEQANTLLGLVPSKEWSEEDENGLGDAIWCCKQAASIAKDENDMGNVWYAEHWLKSIKDRVQPKNQWKPSDAQIRALEYIIDNAHNTSYSCKIAKELLEQLRRLKGE